MDMSRKEHFKHAWGILVELKRAEVALAIHMVAPRFYETYASDKIKELAERLK